MGKILLKVIKIWILNLLIIINKVEFLNNLFNNLYNNKYLYNSKINNNSNNNSNKYLNNNNNLL